MSYRLLLALLRAGPSAVITQWVVVTGNCCTGHARATTRATTARSTSWKRPESTQSVQSQGTRRSARTK